MYLIELSTYKCLKMESFRVKMNVWSRKYYQLEHNVLRCSVGMLQWLFRWQVQNNNGAVLVRSFCVSVEKLSVVCSKCVWSLFPVYVQCALFVFVPCMQSFFDVVLVLCTCLWVWRVQWLPWYQISSEEVDMILKVMA